MWTQPLRALIVQIALVMAAALVARRAKPAALVLGATAFVGAPWLAGPIPLLRGLIALKGFIDLLRVVDVVRSRDPWSARRRVIHVLSFVDTRTVRPAPHHLDLAAIGRALLWGGLGAGAFYVALSPLLLMRWAGGVVFVYSAIESGYAFIGALYRAFGFVTPPLHVSPFASTSISELWGSRWARPVSGWLRDTCFRPLARRGHPMLGLVLGFAVSAVGHAYPVLVALDASMAAAMVVFFIAQGIFVLLEARLWVAGWSSAARRTWTVTMMVGSSPLFVEPTLRVLVRQ
jgi:hypothetical protein